MTETSEPASEAAFFTTIRGWGITRDEGWIAGVVSGCAKKLGLDRKVARVIAVILVLASFGYAVTAYVAAWALLPSRDGTIVIQELGRGRPRIGALIGIGIGALIGLNSINFRQNHGFELAYNAFSLAVFALVVALVFYLVQRRDDSPTTAEPPRAATAQMATPPTPAPKASAAEKTSAAAKASAVAAEPLAELPDDRKRGATKPSPTPYTPGPGRSIYLFFFAAALFTLAGVWSAERNGELKASVAEAWFAALVILVGVTILLVGVLGRRIGFFGFLGTVLILGWVFALHVYPRAIDWADENVHLNIDRVEYSWRDLDRAWELHGFEGIECDPLNAGLVADVRDDGKVITVGSLDATVTVTTREALIVIPEGAEWTLMSSDYTAGTVSSESLNETCQFNNVHHIIKESADSAESITILVERPGTDIVIEEATS